MLAGPGTCDVEGEAHDALDTSAREDADVGGGLPGLVGVAAAAVAGVFPLGVFADDDPVELASIFLAGGEGGGDAVEDAGGTDIGVLLEGLADGEAEAPERNVVGD